MKFGLRESDLNYIVNSVSSHKEIEKAVIFGSRAMGNYRPGSDIDIAIYGTRISHDTVSSLWAMLNEYGPLPYFIDIVDYTHLSHVGMKEHIDRAGIVIHTGPHYNAPVLEASV